MAYNENPTTPTLSSGTYTPTLTNTTNVVSSVSYLAQYMRVGSTVTVSGRVDIDVSLTATSTVLNISLPIASNLANTQNLGGTAYCPAIAALGAAIYADATGDTAQLEYISSDVNNRQFSYHFTYQII